MGGQQAGQWQSLDQMLDEVASHDAPRVAFAISGGGAAGAYQAGVIQAYAEAVAARRRCCLAPTSLDGQAMCASHRT